MAVTAEEQAKFEQFDKQYYEIQRRILLAPNLGKIAIEAETLEAIEQRRRDELIDGIAEAIPGIVKNKRQYRLVNNQLVAKNGQPIEQLLINGLHNSIRQASEDEFYAPFGPQRARHELDELREWQALAKEPGQHNTILTFSPYSEEYASKHTLSKLQLAGQAPEDKRGMVRIGHWDGNEFHIITRSVDNSSMDLFKTVANEVVGYEFKAEDTTSMLGERIKLSMDLEQAEVLADDLVGLADIQLAYKHGGVRRQGRVVQEAKNTQIYVESQSQIVEHLLLISKNLAKQHGDYDSYKNAWENELHKNIALLHSRLEFGDNREIIDISAAAEAAGLAAEAIGKTYNMCGLVVGGSKENQLASDTAFESLKNLSGKKIQCPECKESVVVADSKLKQGKLCCPECRYEVDVCTGQVHSKSNSKNNNNAIKSKLPAAPGNLIAAELARIDADIARKRALKKQRGADAGKLFAQNNSVTSF